MTELLAPNGKKSNLTLEQWNLVRTLAFKQWFGDWENLILSKLNDSGIDEVSLKRLEDGVSKVVDENGEPKVKWRGDNNPKNVFDYINYDGHAVYYFGDKMFAESYGDKLNSYFINAKNPFIPNKLTDKEEKEIRNLLEKDANEILREAVKNNGFANLYDFLDNYYLIEAGFNENSNSLDILLYQFKHGINYFILELRPIIEWLKNNDYNGYESYEGNNDNIAVFNSNQIKLADGTNTTFDGNNPDIRFEKGGNVDYVGNNYLKKKYNHLKKENTTFEDLPTIYIRVGLPSKTGDKYQPSRNYLLGTLEEGVSVFTAKYSPNSNFVFVDLENYKYFLTETYEAFVYGFPLKDGEMSDEKYIMYLLEGSPLMWGKKGAQNYVYQEGSDGERLLDTKTITVIGELNPEKIIKYSSDYDEDVIDKETFSGIELQQYPKYADGGRTIAQTPSLKKDQIYGSDKNKQGSSKSLKSAKQIKFDEQTLLSIANKVKQHNTKHPDKKITIDSAKAVVRRGMGAYSTSHRPTIKNGKPNNRIAWGLARLNAFTYKIINGKSKSGKYTQDDDLIKELNYMVKSYKDGGNVPKSNKMFHLPLELVVYVPSTKDVNKTISKQEMKERVDEVKNYLGVAFGGYSSIKIEGGYVANNGELVSENITKVVSFASKDDYEKNKDELVNQMTNWSQKWGQEAIGFEFEGDLYYVPEKLKKGGEITNTKNGETKIAKSGIHEGWGFKDTFKVLLKGAKSNIIKTFKELNLLFPDYDKEVIKGETIEIYIEENSFNKVKKIANYNDLTILYEDGGQIDYSTGWNQDYESDPLVIGKKKAKELATRGVLAYATRGQSELSRAANKGQDNENGQEQNEMFAQLAKSGALGKMEHGGEVHYSMGGQSMNNGIEKAFKEISEKNPPITNFLKRGGTTLKQETKISKVMREFKEGKLHSGSKKGPVVKDREQAIAIALSEANVKRKRN